MSENKCSQTQSFFIKSKDSTVPVNWIASQPTSFDENVQTDSKTALLLHFICLGNWMSDLGVMLLLAEHVPVVKTERQRKTGFVLLISKAETFMHH